MNHNVFFVPVIFLCISLVSSNSSYSSDLPLQVNEPSTVSENVFEDEHMKLHKQIPSETAQTSSSMPALYSSLTSNKEKEVLKILDEVTNKTTLSPDVLDDNSTLTDTTSSQTSGVLVNYPDSNLLEKESEKLTTKLNDTNKETNRANGSSENVLLSKTFDNSTFIPTTQNTENSSKSITDTNGIEVNPAINGSLLRETENAETHASRKFLDGMKNNQSHLLNRTKNLFTDLDQPLVKLPATPAMNSFAKNSKELSDIPNLEKEDSFSIKQRSTSFKTPIRLKAQSNKDKKVNGMEYPQLQLAESPKSDSSVQLLTTQSTHYDTGIREKALPQELGKNIESSVKSKATLQTQQPTDHLGSISKNAVHYTGNRSPVIVPKLDKSSRVDNNIFQDISEHKYPYENLGKPYSSTNKFYSLNSNLDKPKLSINNEINLLQTLKPNSLSSSQTNHSSYSGSDMEKYNIIPHGLHHFPTYSYPIQTIHRDNIIKHPISHRLYSFVEGKLYLLVPVQQNAHTTIQNNNKDLIFANLLQQQHSGLNGPNTVFRTKPTTEDNDSNRMNDHFNENLELNTFYSPKNPAFKDFYNEWQQINGINYENKNSFTSQHNQNNKDNLLLNYPHDWFFSQNIPQHQAYSMQRQNQNHAKQTSLFSQNQISRDRSSVISNTSPLHEAGLSYSPESDYKSVNPHKLVTSAAISENPFIRQSYYDQHLLALKPTLHNQNDGYLLPLQSLQNQYRVQNPTIVIDAIKPQVNNIDYFEKEDNILYLNNTFDSSTQREFNPAFLVKYYPNQKFYINNDATIDQQLNENSPRSSTPYFGQQGYNHLDSSRTYSIENSFRDKKQRKYVDSLNLDTNGNHPYVSSGDDHNNAYATDFNLINKPYVSFDSSHQRQPPKYPNMLTLLYKQSNLNNVRPIERSNPPVHPYLQLYPFPQQSEAYTTQNSHTNSSISNIVKITAEDLVNNSDIASNSWFSQHNQSYEDEPIKVSVGDQLQQLYTSTTDMETNKYSNPEELSHAYHDVESNFKPPIHNEQAIYRDQIPLSYQYLPSNVIQNVPIKSTQDHNYLQLSIETIPDIYPQSIDDHISENTVSNPVVSTESGYNVLSSTNSAQNEMASQLSTQENHNQLFYGADGFNSRRYKNPLENLPLFRNPNGKLNYNLPKNTKWVSYHLPIDNSGMSSDQSPSNSGASGVNLEYISQLKDVSQTSHNTIKEYSQTHTDSVSNQNNRLYPFLSNTDSLGSTDHSDLSIALQHGVPYFQQRSGKSVVPSRTQYDSLYGIDTNYVIPTEPINGPEKNLNYNSYSSVKNPHQLQSLFGNYWKLPKENLNDNLEQTLIPRPDTQYYSIDGNQNSQRIYESGYPEEYPSFSGPSQSVWPNNLYSGEIIERRHENMEMNSLNKQSTDWETSKSSDARYLEQPSIPGHLFPSVGSEADYSNVLNYTATKSGNDIRNLNHESEILNLEGRDSTLDSNMQDHANKEFMMQEERTTSPSTLIDQQLTTIRTNRIQDGNAPSNNIPHNSNYYDHETKQWFTSNDNSLNLVPEIATGYTTRSNINSNDGTNLKIVHEVYPGYGSNNPDPSYMINEPHFFNKPAISLSEDVQDINTQSSSMAFSKTGHRSTDDHLAMLKKPILSNPNPQISEYYDFNTLNIPYSSSQFSGANKEDGLKYFTTQNQVKSKTHYTIKNPTVTRDNEHRSTFLTFQTPQTTQQKDNQYSTTIYSSVPIEPNHYNEIPILENSEFNEFNPHNSEQFNVLKNSTMLNTQSQNNTNTVGVAQNKLHYSDNPSTNYGSEQLTIYGNQPNGNVNKPNSLGMAVSSYTGHSNEYLSSAGLNNLNLSLAVEQESPETYARYKKINTYKLPLERRETYYSNNNNDNDHLDITTDLLESNNENSHLSKQPILSQTSTKLPSTYQRNVEMAEQNTIHRNEESFNTNAFNLNTLTDNVHNTWDGNHQQISNNDYNINRNLNTPILPSLDHTSSFTSSVGKITNIPYTSKIISSHTKNMIDTNNAFQSHPMPASNLPVTAVDPTLGGFGQMNNNFENKFFENSRAQNKTESGIFWDGSYDHLSETFQKQIAKLNERSKEFLSPKELYELNQNKVLPMNTGSMTFKNKQGNTTAYTNSVNNVEHTIVTNTNSKSNQTLQRNGHLSTGFSSLKPGGCTINGINMDVGEEWTVTGVCGVFICLSNGIDAMYSKCPELKYTDSQQCEVKEGDPQQEFPLCCPLLQCTSKTESITNN